MNNFVTSLIRTYVPMGVGAVVSYLVSKGIELDVDAQLGLITAMTAVLQGLYYLAARLVERRFPQAGTYLLGSASKPKYSEPTKG